MRRLSVLMAVAALALIVAAMLLLGGFSASPTVGADNAGSLAGTYDIVVTGGLPTGLYHCIAKIDHDSVSNTLASHSVCYADINLDDANGEPPALPGEGPDLVAGPPPPPPFTTTPPQAGSGTISAGTATLTSCIFPSIGGTAAPNVIATISVPLSKTDIADGVLAGTMTFYSNQPNASCASLTPAGGGAALPVILYRVADKVPSGQSGGTGGCDNSPLVNTLGHARSAHCTDFDEDGCTDQAELLNTGATACGDDPYNPYDSSISDLDGTYYTRATLAGESCGSGEPSTPCPFGSGAPDPAPGAYIHCISSLNYISASNIHNRIYCYLDSPALEVNPEAYPGCHGDGFPGASPPGGVSSTFYSGACSQTLWGGMGTTQTDLSGSLAGSTLTTTGCFRDLYGTNLLGNFYVIASQNAYSGVGTMSIYPNQTVANCVGGSPVGSLIAATLQVARQSSDFSRDSDGDGCTDAQELQDTTLRDPFNRWDGFDVTGNGLVNVADILGVVAKFGLSSGDPGYNETYDRGGPLPGGHLWNLSEPNGTISWDDVVDVVTLYGSNCNSSFANDAGQHISLLTLDGALSKAGSAASILAGERLRWTCYAASGASVTLRFHYTWGDSDVSGTGTTSFTHNPTVQLQSVECLVNSSSIGQITINWILLATGPAGGEITISSMPSVPAGLVYDSVSFAPIPGATVWLEYLDGATWRKLDQNNATDKLRMEPDFNPQSSNLTGDYGWDVLPGQYRVQVSKLGCTSNTRGPVKLPITMDAGIVCGDADGDGLPTFFETTSSGGTHTLPYDPETVDGIPDGEVADCDGDSLTNLVEVTVYHTDPCGSDNVDSDLDGCSNIEELGAIPDYGGDRDTGNFWDFYDVWTHPGGDPGAGWERDHNVGLFGDIFQVAGRFGAEGSPLTSPLTPPTNETGYHPDYDRSPPGVDPWDIGRGDGTIDLFNDIFAVALQFGHACNGPS